MKTIVITRSNPIEPDSRVEKEANSLTKAGYKVILVAWDRDENYFVKHQEKQLEDTSVLKVSFGAKAEFGAGFKSIVPFLKFQICLLLWIVKHRQEIDYFHFCDFDTAFTGSIVCRLFRKKYVFDIFDYNSTDAYTVFQKLIEKLENNVINHAETTILCTEKRREQIRKAHPKKVEIIHNSPTNLDIEEEKCSQKNERIKVAYVGILQDFRLIKEMLQVISEMPEVELHIGGFGKYDTYVKNMAALNENIIYYGRMQYKETILLEQQCDIMTAIYDPQIGNHRYAAPNKFYEALMLGKPLLMVKNTGMSEIVEKENLGEVISYSTEGFKQGLEKLIQRKAEWEKIANKMRNIYLCEFSWNEMERRLKELYFSL